MPCEHFSVTFIAQIFEYASSIHTTDFLNVFNTAQQELNISIFEQYLTFEYHIIVEGTEDEKANVLEHKSELSHKGSVVHFLNC